MFPQVSIVAYPQAYSHQETGLLGYQRAQRHALHLQSAHIYQAEAGGDVHQVLCDCDGHRDAGVLHADVPAGQAVEAQHGGGAPDADMEIGLGQFLDFLRGMDEEEGHFPDGDLEDDEDKSGRHPDTDGPYGHLDDIDG